MTIRVTAPLSPGFTRTVRSMAWAEEFERRFWRRVQKTDACWIWQGLLTPGGYGRLKRNGRMVFAHRAAWEMLIGVVPESLFVLHNCPGGDNPRCVRPDHLWLGTLADNNRDRKSKGRSATGDRNGMRLHPDRHPSKLHPESHVRGERHPSAKMSDQLVAEIIARYGQGGVSQFQLSKEYSISQSSMSRIITRKTWGHVDAGSHAVRRTL